MGLPGNTIPKTILLKLLRLAIGLGVAFLIDKTRPVDGRPSHVVITGASSGLGAALARAYAAPDVRLSLQGRSVGRLADTTGDCELRGASVFGGVLDVTDRSALVAWLLATDDEHPVDLVIANAGQTGGVGADGSPEPELDARALFDVNYFALVATVEALIPRLCARQRGQVALMSSLAAFRSPPEAPTYAATKGAVRLYGEALRSRLAPRGVNVSVICPGFLDTPMTARTVGRKPAMISADAAAHRIVRGLARDEPLMAFPWHLYLGLRVSAFLPARWVDAAARRFEYRVLPEEMPESGVR